MSDDDDMLTTGNVCLTVCLMMIMKYCGIFFSWLHNHSGPKPPHYSVFEITSDAQHSKHTDSLSPGRIRPHNPNSRVAADQRLKARGHWGRQDIVAGQVKFGKIIFPVLFLWSQRLQTPQRCDVLLTLRINWTPALSVLYKVNLRN
jgi:hypothetical protein